MCVCVCGITTWHFYLWLCSVVCYNCCLSWLCSPSPGDFEDSGAVWGLEQSLFSQCLWLKTLSTQCFLLPVLWVQTHWLFPVSSAPWGVQSQGFYMPCTEDQTPSLQCQGRVTHSASLSRREEDAQKPHHTFSAGLNQDDNLTLNNEIFQRFQVTSQISLYISWTQGFTLMFLKLQSKTWINFFLSFRLVV